MHRLLLFVFAASLWAQAPIGGPVAAGAAGAGGTCAGLGGDVTGTCAANTVVKVNGTSVPTSAGALGTDANGALIAVTPGGGTTPGAQPNQPVSGCGVEYVSGLTFNVGACTYTIGGVQYTSPQTSITLAAADPTNPRIDVIHVNNASVVADLQGTPAATPAQPTVDYSTELPLNIVLVPANSSIPGGIATTTIYDENTEWTSTCSAHLNCASTTNPFRGTKDIEATAAVLGNNFTLVKPAAGTVDLSTQNTLVFYIRSKAQWPTANNTGASGLRTLSLFWLNGSTQVGVQVVLKDGAFGFSSSITSTYQQIAIPISNFGAGSNLVTTLKAQVTGNGGTSSFGWYIDAVSLQSGQAPISLPATLMNFRGTWNSTVNYNQNDVVVSNGIGYLALVPNTNVAVTATATWNALGTLNADQHLYPSANCVSSTAGSAWSLPAASTFTPTCRAGTNNLNGTLQAIPSTGATAYFQFQLPSDWITTSQPYVKIYYGSGANVSGTVIWTLSTGCTKSDGSVTDDPAFVAESAMGTQTMAAANRTWAQSAQFAQLTSGNNCIAGSIVDLRLVLSGTAASAINVMYATITTPRLPVVQAN